ncbi:hypothetical protein IFR04_001348 [Cadophora malorum]|uniref:Uncharacterized protein n=1 Tax=Cadophora malorum TaxID=108018 RepID=A0A8H7WIB7_9HELO|nr:hypothetical protein IFR04_001348 [Cadophora malorum]
MSVIVQPHNIPIRMDAVNSAPQLELKVCHIHTLFSCSTRIPNEPNTTPSPSQSPAVPFPLLSLPPELLHQIVANYYALLPPLTITKSNHQLPHHALTPLALSSPHLLSILPPSLYYAHATFLFSSPSLLKPFADGFNRVEQVRKIKIWYGALGPLGPGTGTASTARGQEEGCTGDGEEKGNGRQDWVFSFLEAFRGLEEVTFVVELGMSKGFCERSRHVRVMEGWWECVRDAVREGWGASASASAQGKAKGRVLVMRVECEGFEGFWVDRICA